MCVVSSGDANGMKMSTTSAGSCTAILSKTDTPIGLLPLIKSNLVFSHLTCRRQCI